MFKNLQIKTPTRNFTLLALLLAAVLGGCASAGESWSSAIAENPRGSRMGLPIDPCESCTLASRNVPANDCPRSCKGLCCNNGEESHKRNQ